MTTAQPWPEFVETHGEITGFDMGEWFIPIPADQHWIDSHYQAAKLRGHDPGTPVYSPTSIPETTP